MVSGHEKLNLAFVANLFNNHPGLDPPEEEVTVIEETREEKMFRNWMNSLGVRPHVNYIYSDLCNGLVIFQLMDYIRPGIVDWDKRVIRQEKMSAMSSKRFQEILSNCNYAVELARKLNLVIVGIAGSLSSPPPPQPFIHFLLEVLTSRRATPPSPWPWSGS